MRASPDITDYDLQFRENGTSDATGIPWPHSGTETTTVISSGLQAGTQYEVQVLARNSEGASDWSELRHWEYLRYRGGSRCSWNPRPPPAASKRTAAMR